MEFDAVLIEPRIQEMTQKGFWLGKTVNDYFDACLDKCPDKRALTSIQVASGARRDLTFRELGVIANRVAVGLSRLGVERNDVVTCQLPNCWQFVATFLACARIGAAFNPVMHIFRQHELSFMLRHGEAKVFIVPKVFRGFDHEAMAEEMRPALPDLAQVIVLDGEGGNSFDALLLDPVFDDDTEIVHIAAASKPGPNDVCQLIFTSGTTGEPKGVMHTSNTLFSNLVPYAERLRLTGDDVIMMASPMAHQTGYVYGGLMPFMLQAHAILLDSWDKDLAAKIVAEEKCTFTMASTPFLMDLTAAVEAGKTDSSSLRIFLCAGTAIPGPVVEKARAVLGAKIVSAWGMSENGAVTLINPDDPDERAVSTDGYPLAGMEIRIVRSEGTLAAADEEGELQVRGCSNFGGYLKRPQLNNTDAEGWFGTGDVARMDSQGYIRICGRIKDVIIRGGENIPVVEVESTLFKHPDLAMVAIVSYPDERLGERACAFVVPKPGASFTFDDMTQFLAGQQLAKQYWPERLEVREALPATASGKIQKFALREMLRSGAANPN